jgi:DNA-binding MarR family transcriptional regulator
MSEPPAFSPTIALLATARAWEAELTDALKPLGLTHRKYGLLGHVRATPGISFSELARRSGITVQSVHAAVAGLVADGLVDDGTAHAGSASTLEVTPGGERLLEQAADVVATLDARLAAPHPELVDGLRAYVADVFTGRP